MSRYLTVALLASCAIFAWCYVSGQGDGWVCWTEELGKPWELEICEREIP